MSLEPKALWFRIFEMSSTGRADFDMIKAQKYVAKTCCSPKLYDTVQYYDFINQDIYSTCNQKLTLPVNAYISPIHEGLNG